MFVRLRDYKYGMDAADFGESPKFVNFGGIVIISKYNRDEQRMVVTGIAQTQQNDHKLSVVITNTDSVYEVEHKLRRLVELLMLAVRGDLND